MEIVNNFFKYDGTVDSISRLWDYLLEIQKFNDTKYFLQIGKDQFFIIYEREDDSKRIEVNLNDCIVFRGDSKPWCPTIVNKNNSGDEQVETSIVSPPGEKEDDNQLTSIKEFRFNGTSKCLYKIWLYLTSISNYGKVYYSISVENDYFELTCATPESTHKMIVREGDLIIFSEDSVIPFVYIPQWQKELK